MGVGRRGSAQIGWHSGGTGCRWTLVPCGHRVFAAPTPSMRWLWNGRRSSSGRPCAWPMSCPTRSSSRRCSAGTPERKASPLDGLAFCGNCLRLRWSVRHLSAALISRMRRSADVLPVRRWQYLPPLRLDIRDRPWGPPSRVILFTLSSLNLRPIIGPHTH